jgi:hypothetical protein
LAPDYNIVLATRASLFIEFQCFSPPRFRIPLPLPHAQAILTAQLAKMPAGRHLVGAPETKVLAGSLEGLSGAEIENGVREGAMSALRADLSCSTLSFAQLASAFA